MFTVYVAGVVLTGIILPVSNNNIVINHSIYFPPVFNFAYINYAITTVVFIVISVTLLGLYRLNEYARRFFVFWNAINILRISVTIILGMYFYGNLFALDRNYGFLIVATMLPFLVGGLFFENVRVRLVYVKKPLTMFARSLLLCAICILVLLTVRKSEYDLRLYKEDVSYAIGNRYLEEKDYQRAIGYYENALTLGTRKRIISANNKIAFSCYQLEDDENSLQYSRRVLLYDPENLYALKGMAHCYHNTRQHSKVKKTLEKVLEIDPSDKWAKRMLDNILEVKGIKS